MWLNHYHGFSDVSSMDSTNRVTRRFRPTLAALSVGAAAASLLFGSVVTTGTASAGHAPSTPQAPQIH